MSLIDNKFNEFLEMIYPGATDKIPKLAVIQLKLAYAHGITQGYKLTAKVVASKNPNQVDWLSISIGQFAARAASELNSHLT